MITASTTEADMAGQQHDVGAAAGRTSHRHDSASSDPWRASTRKPPMQHVLSATMPPDSPTKVFQEQQHGGEADIQPAQHAQHAPVGAAHPANEARNASPFANSACEAQPEGWPHGTSIPNAVVPVHMEQAPPAEQALHPGHGGHTQHGRYMPYTKHTRQDHLGMQAPQKEHVERLQCRGHRGQAEPKQLMEQADRNIMPKHTDDEQVQEAQRKRQTWQVPLQELPGQAQLQGSALACQQAVRLSQVQVGSDALYDCVGTAQARCADQAPVKPSTGQTRSQDQTGHAGQAQQQKEDEQACQQAGQLGQVQPGSNASHRQSDGSSPFAGSFAQGVQPSCLNLTDPPSSALQPGYMPSTDAPLKGQHAHLREDAGATAMRAPGLAGQLKGVVQELAGQVGHKQGQPAGKVRCQQAHGETAVKQHRATTGPEEPYGKVGAEKVHGQKGSEQPVSTSQGLTGMSRAQLPQLMLPHDIMMTQQVQGQAGTEGSTTSMEQRCLEGRAMLRSQSLAMASKQAVEKQPSTEELVAWLWSCMPGGDMWEIKMEELDMPTGQRIGFAPAGSVHKATWRGTTEVAVKRLHTNVPRELFAFRSQASVFTRLRHPDILQALGLVIQPPIAYVVSEMMCRGNIYQMLHPTDSGADSLPNMLPSHRLSAALACARALSYMHTCSPPLMHLDIKTANLFTDEHGNVRLCGFWLARPVVKRTAISTPKSSLAASGSIHSPTSSAHSSAHAHAHAIDVEAGALKAAAQAQIGMSEAGGHPAHPATTMPGPPHPTGLPAAHCLAQTSAGTSVNYTSGGSTNSATATHFSDNSVYRFPVDLQEWDEWWPTSLRINASAEWMSPEALRGEPLDEKSDVFSFGVVLWEFCTNDTPWTNVTHPTVVAYLVGMKGERLPLPDDIDPTLKQLILDCWEDDPRKRPSMIEVYQRLSTMHQIVPSQACQVCRWTKQQAMRQAPDQDPQALLASLQMHPWLIRNEDLTRGRRLGVGAFGEVFHGWWHNSTEVAIKVLLEQDLCPDDLLAFKNEVTLMSKLRHPNVVQFLGAVLEPPHLSIVAEYMPAGTLFQLLHRNHNAHQVDGRRRLRMAKDVAKGLQYLHAHKPAICHRDLKSPNLLCDRDGTVKLADFGLSRAKAATFVTGKGTPAWKAPEALRDGLCDERSDVFSYGVVLWELATGDIPWKGLARPDALPFLIANGDRLEVPEDIDPVVRSLILDCWQEIPSKRPTCGQILKRLATIKEIVPSPSHAQSWDRVCHLGIQGLTDTETASTHSATAWNAGTFIVNPHKDIGMPLERESIDSQQVANIVVIVGAPAPLKLEVTLEVEVRR